MKAIHIITQPGNHDALTQGLHAMCETFEGAAVIYPITGGMQLTVPNGFEPDAICDVLVEAEIIDPTRDEYTICEV